MLVAPGPIEVVQAIMRRRREALAKAIAACAIACSLWARIGRQRVARAVQRLAQAGDVAVAEDREDAGEQRQLRAVDLGRLRGEEADQSPARRSRRRVFMTAFPLRALLAR